MSHAERPTLPAEQEVLGTRGCVFVLQSGQWKERAIGNIKLVLDLRTLDIQIVANSVDDRIITYLLTSRVRSKGPRAWVMKARAASTSTEEILAMRFGHESDSEAFKDFMEHAYLLDRQITTLRQEQRNAGHRPKPIGNQLSVKTDNAHPRLDRKTSTASFKLATQQQFPGSQTFIPQPKPVTVVPLSESNLRHHDKIFPPKKRTVQAWLDQCEALQSNRSMQNMKTLNHGDNMAHHMDYIANRLQASGRT